MSVRYRTLGTLLAVFALWPAWLAAQQPTSAGATQQLTNSVTQLTQQVSQLAGQLKIMQEDINQLKAQSPQQQAGAPEAVASAAGKAKEESTDRITRAEFQALQDQVKANTDLIDSVDDRLASMREDNKELLAQVFEQNNQQSELLAAISTQGAAGNPIPNLRAIMNDSQGRQTLEGAVHEVMRRQGTVTIENRMPQGYSITLNRQPHYVASGEIKTFSGVPVGNVTTELVGYEEPKHWALTPPAYDLKIVIAPRQSQVVRRVASPVGTVYQVADPVVYTPVQVWYGQ